MSVNDDTSVFEQHQLQQDDDGIMFVESNVLANPLDQQQYEYQYQYEQQEPVDGTYEYAVMEQPMEALTFEEESVSPNPVDQEMSNENPIEEQPVEQVPPEKPKGATKRKSDPNGKSFCETFVDKSMATPQQLKAIECLGTERGMIQMNIWLNAAIEENDIPRLCVLLAQCYHAEITLTLLSAGSAPKTVRGLRKFANKDVQRAASEVYQKWFAIVESNVKKTSTEKSIAKAAVKRPALPKGVGIASNSLDLLDAEDEPTPSASPSKRVSLKARPKTARTRQTKFRLTGFEEDADTQDAPVTMPVKTLTQKAGAVSSRPTTNAIATPPAPAVVSDAFANALAASSTGPPPPKVVRKTPPVINRPPVIPAPSMGELNSSASSRESLFTSPVDKLKHFNGPDRSRVPLPGQPRRIHFADDFEDPRPLVAIKYIPPRERICVSANQSQRDMQHADAESERRSLEKSKLEQLVEDDDEEQQQQQPPPVEPETPMPPKKRLLSKNIVRKIQTVLYKEEEDRKSRTMSYFALKGIIRDMPSAPDKVTPYAYTSDFNEMIKIYCTSKKPNEEDISGSTDDVAAAVQPVEDVKSVIEPIQIDESPASPPPETKPEPQIALIENFDIHSAHASANTAKKNPSVSLLTPDLKNILNNLRQSETIKKALASASGAGPSTPTARPPPPSVPSGSIDIVEVPIDIHSGGPPVPIPMPPVMIPGPRPQFRGPVPPFGGGFRPRLPLTPCRFFFQGRCTKGVHCPFAHNGPPQPIAPVPPPQRHPVSRGFEPVNDDFHRGRDQYRSRGRGDRYTRRRSPSPLRERRRRRSDSRSPERDDRRHRRRRSPSSDRYYRDSPRSPSRSPIPSRSRSPSPRYPDR